MINIKPLLWLDASGKLVPLAKIRGRKKAIKEMVLQATQDIGHSTAIVAYANDIEAAENLKEQLLAVDGIEKVLICTWTSHLYPRRTRYLSCLYDW